MEKRGILFGTYHTAEDGLWTLSAGWKFSDPVYVQNFVKIPGSSVTLDMSTALSDGEPTYSQRTLTAIFESSEGDRLARKARIDAMVNRLDGRRMDIVLPDDPDHYIIGRISVQVLYNDMAHASVKVVAVGDPWRYNATEALVTLDASTEAQTVNLVNTGRAAVVPTVEIEDGDINLTFGEKTWSLSEGIYKMPDICLMSGNNELSYSGSGTVTLTYREASL